jgi:hypothetical protein
MRKIFFLSLFIFFTGKIFSLSLEDLVNRQQAQVLRSSNELITEVQLKNPAPKLLPNYSELQKFFTEAASGLDANIMVETLYLYKKPSSYGKWNEEQRAALYNRLLAISTLAGIQYYSASRNTMRTFYETSHVIDSPVSKRIISDPFHPVPPPSLMLYARQKDLTFGDNIYSYNFKTFNDSCMFMQENITSLTYGIIQAVGKNRLRTILAVIDTEDSLLIYAVSTARASAVFGMGERIGNSFSNRAEAILKWFSAGADAVFLR